MQTEIADQLEVHKSTISRELSRNKGERGYRPKQANEKAQERRARTTPGKRILAETWEVVAEKLRVLSGIRQFPRETIRGLEKLSQQEPFYYAIPMAVNALLGRKQYAMDLLERAVEANQITF